MDVLTLSSNPQDFVELDGTEKLFSITVEGIKIDLGLFFFSNRILVVISEFEKFGSIVSATRSSSLGGEEREDIFEIKTLFGVDRLEYHVVARALAGHLSSTKPLLFAISLRNVSKLIIDRIREAIQEKENL